MSDAKAIFGSRKGQKLRGTLKKMTTGAQTTGKAKKAKEPNFMSTRG